MRLRCHVIHKVSNGEAEFYSRIVTFPCFPYPGLHVGAHVVRRVMVCQGDLDGSGDIDVEFEDVDAEHAAMLTAQGWRRLGD